eukprot:CAMPEP_0115711184 /NCGR_PEP_ID=MMETSP0272-20121206/73427_1 /TAXON_ID=71861 /ORGANISM="Scrippsiella trochoidea, Strain CCMP3099" /LENGTH=221 /DNA_ID=CAMNT_0003152959 /DNA_START=1 /DNA_END=663 /DNA_ORIENTATION=-
MPWLVFAAANAVVTFLYHPAKVLVSVMFFLCVICLLVVAQPPETWHGAAYSLSICGLALISGAFAGYYNYCVNTYSYWRFTEGREYENVLPDELAAAHADASLLTFAAGVEPIVKFAASYGSGGGTYCAAPILKESAAATSAGPEGVQYWAVGRDCCGASGFFCDGVGVSSAHSGLVVYNRTDIFTPWVGSDVHFYAQAVQMSGARFGLKSAAKPLLLRWV